MYVIIKKLDGTISVEFSYQEGTERRTYETVKEAIKNAKSFAILVNGEKIRKRDIKFLQEQIKKVFVGTGISYDSLRLVEWNPNEQ